MESGLRSCKRKQRPSKSDQLDCIFTRSKSQIYLHRHRSGYARADSIRNRNSMKPLKGTTANSLVEQVQSEPIVDDQITNLVHVKDLRSKRVFSPNAVTINDDVSIIEADLEPDFEKTDAIVNPNVTSVADDSKARTENIVIADELVLMTPIVSESEQNKAVEEKRDAVNEIVDTECFMSKSQSSVTSLRGRRKVFKSPSSFSYRRLLPYLKDLGNDDSSDFEIVEATLPEQAQKSSNKTPDLYRSVESSNVLQKNNEDDLNDALEECEQMTPPDSDVYSKSKTDQNLGVLVKPTSKLVLNPCSRKKVLQTPTSFSHRRLLPFLMSVSADNLCASKVNRSVKLEKATEQNQQKPTLSLLHQNINTDESTTKSNAGQLSTADEESDSPTSTLIQIEPSFDMIRKVTLASNDNALDACWPDTECSESTSHLETNLQAEPVKCDDSIKSEQSLPENNLKCVEEASSKAIETLPSICTEQSIDTNDDLVGLRNSFSKDSQRLVDENAQHSLLQVAPLNAPGIDRESYRIGILKRTPRGCRGICNCLNCTSFRLHADRSFEFSRNQMHDAEEIALELIEDLACLRNILERTVAESNSLATATEKQVKEACEKALYKEEVARAQLAQMNDDLSNHCRSMKLLRPTVTFANKIEEKVIPKEEVYGKKRA